MRLPAYLVSAAGKFNRLSLRERVLVLAALLVVLAGGLNILLIGPVDVRRKALLQEVTNLGSQIALTDSGVEAAVSADPTQGAAGKLQALQNQLQGIDSQLLAQSAGMVPPDHMAEAIQDVLRLQRGVVLISLRNLPPTRLPAEKPAENAGEDRRPYVHAVELVLEGRYLDVLDYVQALEKLPWHFYWRHLEITATHYPTNRVHLELATLSPDGDWIGL
jgi:MSHA biogenesis protein MshJ